MGSLLFSLALQSILRKLAVERSIDDEILDLCLAYLDGCVFAGRLDVVAKGIQLLRDAAAQIGLELNLEKCKLVLTPSCPEDLLLPPLPDGFYPCRANGFKFLGAPIGDKNFCEALTAKRVRKSQDLWDAIGSLADPNVALLLLQHCASFCKIAFSIRSTPAALHADALAEFDTSVRTCFEDLSGLRPSDGQWDQASLAVSMGGLDLRDCRRHAAAAFISSRTRSFDKCQELDRHHTWDGDVD